MPGKHIPASPPSGQAMEGQAVLIVFFAKVNFQ